jgi:hypothetical protein
MKYIETTLVGNLEGTTSLKTFLQRVEKRIEGLLAELPP